MYSLTLLDDNLINRFDEDPSFSLQNSSPLTSSKRKQQYDGGLSDFSPSSGPYLGGGEEGSSSNRLIRLSSSKVKEYISVIEG